MSSRRLQKPCGSFAMMTVSVSCLWGAGHGVRRSRSSVGRKGSHNAEFRSYASRSELGRSLAEGHVGLVTQMPETIGAVVPSKTYGIMAAGRPMLYVGPRGRDAGSCPSTARLRLENRTGRCNEAWSDFYDGWNKIELWCRRREREPGVPLKNTMTSRSRSRGFCLSLAFRRLRRYHRLPVAASSL